jgi:hypothetical protein
MNTLERKENTTTEIESLFSRLSQDKLITRDQERVGKEIATDPNLALITNRLMNQGSDPESLRLIDPESFNLIAEKLGLTSEQAAGAITTAHTKGPASLENESAEENLWLLLASISEEHEGTGSIKERLEQFHGALTDLETFAEFDKEDLETEAGEFKESLLKEIKPIREEDGIPVYEEDIGFFVAYRKGCKAAMVEQPEITFVGTTPDTTLEEQGLKVDKQLTPHFGLRFKNEAQKEAQKVVEETRKQIFKIFTIKSETVEEGANVDTYELKGAKTNIPAIIIGEKGRGRHLGVLPVHLTNSQLKEWREKGVVRINAAEIGKTKAGKPKLFAKKDANSDEQVIAVMPTTIGFRGSNSHTGDRNGETESSSGEKKPTFDEFPGEVLADGTIAQGAAGRAGSGTQIIASIPKDKVFRTGYNGRLYGAPAAHYFKWDGEELLAATWGERQSSDIF